MTRVRIRDSSKEMWSVYSTASARALLAWSQRSTRRRRESKATRRKADSSRKTPPRQTPSGASKKCQRRPPERQRQHRTLVSGSHTVKSTCRICL